MSGRWRPRLRGHGNPRSRRPASQCRQPSIVQSLSLSILPASLSVTCQFCPSTCQLLQPVSQPVSPVSLSFLSTILSASLSANLSVLSVGQPVSRSVGQVTRPHFPVGPCAISGSVVVEAEGPWGREELGGGTLTWRRTRRGFCGRRSRGSGGHHPASVASQGRRRDLEKEGRLDQTTSLLLLGLQ